MPNSILKIMCLVVVLLSFTFQKRHRPKYTRNRNGTFKMDNSIPQRKLPASVLEKLGVDSEINYNFKKLIGGITNIRMAREDPFVVVNTYPVNQYVLPSPKPEINMNYSTRILI